MKEESRNESNPPARRSYALVATVRAYLIVKGELPGWSARSIRIPLTSARSCLIEEFLIKG
jgi:hypothetical protein